MIDDLEVVKAACCIAALDGEICRREAAVIDRLAERAGLGRASLDAMKDRAGEDPAWFEQQLLVLQGDPDRIVKLLFSVAVIDGELGASERVVLQFFADRVGLEAERLEQLLRAAERETDRSSS